MQLKIVFRKLGTWFAMRLSNTIREALRKVRYCGDD
jgi:hypothetical protein